MSWTSLGKYSCMSASIVTTLALFHQSLAQSPVVVLYHVCSCVIACCDSPANANAVAEAVDLLENCGSARVLQKRFRRKEST